MFHFIDIENLYVITNKNVLKILGTRMKTTEISLIINYLTDVLIIEKKHVNNNFNLKSNVEQADNTV